MNICKELRIQSALKTYLGTNFLGLPLTHAAAVSLWHSDKIMYVVITIFNLLTLWLCVQFSMNFTGLKNDRFKK